MRPKHDRWPRARSAGHRPGSDAASDAVARTQCGSVVRSPWSVVRSPLQRNNKSVALFVDKMSFVLAPDYGLRTIAMDKEQVAAVLEEIGTLLELQGENPFRCLAYGKAARAILQMEGSLADVVAAGKLGEIPGIGETLKEKISLLVTTDHLPFYEDLKKKMPPGLLDMLRLPGVGPKKVKAMYEELGIDDMDKLKAACQAGKVAALKGFGAKTEQKILEGIAYLGQVGNRIRLDHALLIADTLMDGLRALPGIKRMEVCGSVRRRRETIRDIDILISAANAEPIMAAFVKLPPVQQIVGQGDTKSSILVAYDGHSGGGLINADLRVVSEKQFPFALNYFTGSKEHNV